MCGVITVILKDQLCYVKLKPSLLQSNTLRKFIVEFSVRVRMVG